MSESSAPKSLTVVGGPNGAGKTTFAEAYLAQQPQPFLSADWIAAELNPQDPTAARIAAGREFLRRVAQQLEAGERFVLESTLSGKTLLRTLDRARDQSFQIKIAFVYLDPVEACIARVNERTRKGGHYVAEEDIRRRFDRSLSNYWRIYRQIADDWSLFYNAGAGFQDIAIGRQDRYSVRDAAAFTHFLSLVGESKYE